MSLSELLQIIALIVFVVAAIGISYKKTDLIAAGWGYKKSGLIAVGLALWMASIVIPQFIH